jgi:hypothetical protein
MTENNGNLLPEPAGTDGAAEWAAMPTGAPEEFGVDTPGPANGNPSTKNYAVEKRRVWQRQEMFLAAYRKCGKIGKAAESVGLTRWGVQWWQKHDVLQFNQRLNMAHEDYCEFLEQGMDERLADQKGNRGSDILYMFKLKAEKPEKFRENAQPQQTDASQELLDRLTAMAAKEIEAGRRLEAGATEAEYRDLGETDRN